MLGSVFIIFMKNNPTKPIQGSLNFIQKIKTPVHMQLIIKIGLLTE